MTHFFGEQEYWSSTEKAVKLIIEQNISIRKAALACNITRSAAERGTKAFREKCEIGIKGHPFILNNDEKEKLHWDNQNRLNNNEIMTYKDVNKLVNLNFTLIIV